LLLAEVYTASCYQVSKTIITVHPIADWAGIICRVRSVVDVRRLLKEEGLGGWSIGKLDAGINCAKLAIRARSRPIFRHCSIFICPTLAELSDTDLAVS